MPDKAWKKRERDVANYFNGERTPLSGGNGKVTRADVIHEDLFIECKFLLPPGDFGPWTALGAGRGLNFEEF